MKKFFSIFLCAVLMLSIVTIPASARDVELAFSGMKDEENVTFVTTVTNNAESKADFKVYVASYGAKDTLKAAKIYKESVEPGERAAFSYSTPNTDGGAKIFVWENGLKPLAPSFTSEYCEAVDLGEEISVPYGASDAFASYTPEAENSAGNVADGDESTVWTVSGASAENSENVTIYLGDDYILSRVGIAFNLGNEREYIYSVSSSEDGENFTTLVQKSTSKKINDMQYLELPPVRARYIRLNLFGRTDNGVWCRIGEIDTYGYKDNVGAILMESAEDWSISPMDEMTYTDYRPALGELLYAQESAGEIYLYDNVGRDSIVDGEKLNISSVTASQTPEANNHHTNVTDGDAATIWTAKDVTDQAPAYLVADLGTDYYLTGAGIGFNLGNERTYAFDIAVSADNKNYTTVVSKRTSASTQDIQYFNFVQTEARYIKYTFYQRTDSKNNGWVRISEIEAIGSSTPIEGAGGILAQKNLDLPKDRGDYKIEFDLNLTDNVYYSGLSITDGIITGGADLDNYAALQLRFDNDGNKFKINRITSNYFNEGNPVALFENSFYKGRNVHFKIIVSPLNRSIFITADDGETKETQQLYFTNADVEMTRNTTWTYLEANTFVLNTGAGAKCDMTLSDFTLREVERETAALSGAAPANGNIRLEAVRLSDYPTSSGDYYGRYIYHNGADEVLSVAADKNPSITRFVERRGLIGCGVSLEAATMPGYFIVAESDAFYLKKIQNNGDFYARATFFKDEVDNVGYYSGKTYSYRTYLQRDNEDKFLYDTTSDKKTGDLKPWKKWSEAQGCFYLKSEASEYVADNFYGNSISSQWWTNYPWKSNNPTNDSYNHSGLITKNNVIVENGELLLKATKVNLSSWVKDKSGETGISYNKWGKTWEQWKGYVGVVSIQNKVYNKNCYIEGSFKQPESPVGYWNAFWLTGRDSWPPEIDIFETLSSSYGAKAWHTAIHGENDQNNLFGKSSKDNINITTGYHTFAMDWGYDYIKFYVDGKCFQRTHNNATLNFQKNLRLILNTGIGGWETEPDSTMIWDDGMRCRYVRSFQY
ncbi:MAG: discoidin domain-containing protein [Clostridia bacterium]|nr:discoidin domain-containing protein [Clostridia bacterium]